MAALAVLLLLAAAGPALAATSGAQQGAGNAGECGSQCEPGAASAAQAAVRVCAVRVCFALGMLVLGLQRRAAQVLDDEKLTMRQQQRLSDQWVSAALMCLRLGATHTCMQVMPPPPRSASWSQRQLQELLKTTC